MDFTIKVLVVEDELTTQLLVKRLLKKIGFQDVRTVEDGEAALKELKNDKFGLIISDWKMPNMDGLQFLKTIRKWRRYQDIPFIMITVETEKKRIIEALEAGANQYIVKPPQLATLQAKVEELIGV